MARMVILSFNTENSTILTFFL